MLRTQKTSSISTSITVGAGWVERHRIGSSALFLFQETRPLQIIFQPRLLPLRVPARAPPPRTAQHTIFRAPLYLHGALIMFCVSAGVVCIALNQPRRRTSLHRRLFSLSLSLYILIGLEPFARTSERVCCVSCSEPVNQVNHVAAPTRQLLNLSLVD
jgi:hypothetical protein